MQRAFEVRATMECGWNLFHRQGESEDAATIAFNRAYLDHLREAGLNRVIVFWANTESFDHAWAEAASYAHSIGLKLGRAIFGFAAGAREAPGAPAHLLRDSARGPRTTLCPQDAETRAWVAGSLGRMLRPDMDLVDIETARQTHRRCLCSKCSDMDPYEWDVFVVNFLAENILRIRPDVELYMHVFVECFAGAGPEFARAYRRLNGRIRHIFGWGADDEKTIAAWYDLDARFEHFAKLGRVLLFPGGAVPTTSACERVSRVFRWCRLAAEKGKTGYLFDYRIFGGMEWESGDGRRPCPVPVTRPAKRLPASIAVMGAAMNNPWMDESSQRAFLDRLKEESDWDLDDPAHFWIGSGAREDPAR